MGDQKSVGSNQDSASSLRDSYSGFFDERPDDSDIDGALYHKPSVLKKIGVWFRDVGAQFTAFFVGLGEGIASAWTTVKRVFGSEDQAQQAVRHIHQPIDTAAPISKSQATAAPVHHVTHTPVELTDEDAFALFVDEFKQARREEREFSGAGRQQFEDAAKRHAQKLLDA
ncbi:MAG: hypothetical protein RL369_2042 [Pseudomonadota bacterium]